MTQIKKYTAVFGSYILESALKSNDSTVITQDHTCTSHLSATQKNRLCKWAPWLYIDTSTPMLYHDANISVSKNYLTTLIPIIEENQNIDFIFFEHIENRTLREEILECLRLGKINFSESRVLLSFLRNNEEFSELKVLDFGCFISNVRQENRVVTKNLVDEFLRLPQRDQIVMRILLEKTVDVKIKILSSSVREALATRYQHKHLMNKPLYRKVANRLNGIFLTSFFKLLDHGN